MTERWLEQARSQLLVDCDYYHVIFTVSHELEDLWRWNRKAFGDALLVTVRETLLELLKDPKWLGAVPGMILVLHTGGRNLGIHPHVHVLVTAGGWTRDGWQEPTYGSYLVPGNKLRAKFRNQFVARLGAGLKSGELVVPHDGEVGPWLERLSGLEERKWYVHIRAKYPHGRGVMIYLARYLRGGPLKRTQLLSLRDGKVTFRHFDYRAGDVKEQTLSQEKFIVALAEHVPEPNQVMVRYAGIWANGKREQLTQCREWLGMSAAVTPEYLTAMSFLERVGLEERTKCPVCGKRLEMVELKVCSGLPPPRQGQRDAA